MHLRSRQGLTFSPRYKGMRKCWKESSGYLHSMSGSCMEEDLAANCMCITMKNIQDLGFLLFGNLTTKQSEKYLLFVKSTSEPARCSHTIPAFELSSPHLSIPEFDPYSTCSTDSHSSDMSDQGPNLVSDLPDSH